MTDLEKFYLESTGITRLTSNVPFIEQGIAYSNYLGSVMYPISIIPTKGHKDSNIQSMLKMPWYQNDTHTDKYTEILSLFGVAPTDEESVRDFTIIKYLLSVCACFVEVPKWKTTGGVKEPTYDKFICTTNPEIAMAWSQTTDEKTKTKYAEKLNTANSSSENHELLLLKLGYKTEKEPKVTVPRKTTKIDGIICTPIVFLDSFLKGMLPNFSNGILRVTYLKDNGTLRVIDTTTSETELLGIYNDENYVANVLNHLHVSSLDNNYDIANKFARGYIQVPELGASRYDYSGARAINLTRIVNIARITSDLVDKTFVDVDLEAVPEKFKRNAYVYVQTGDVATLKQLLLVLEKKAESEYDNKTAAELYVMLENYIDTTVTYFGTSALRMFHLFLTNNPLIFPKYVGYRPVQVTS